MITQADPAFRSLSQGEPYAKFTSWEGHGPAELSGDLLKLLDDLERRTLRADGTLQAIARSLTANVTNPHFFYQLGRNLQQRRRYEHAAQHYQRAIQIQPLYVAAYVGMASVRRAQGRLAEAAATLEKILGFQPDSAALHAELAAVLEAQGDFATAVRRLRLAVEINPALAGAWFRLGALLQQEGETAEAKACLVQGIQGEPADRESRLVRSLITLQLGDFAAGWQGFELRHAARPSGATPPVEWRLPRLARQSVMVRSEGRLADDLMFASCLGELIPLVRQAVIECDPAVASLMARSFPAVAIVARSAQDRGEVEGPNYDAEILSGDLPRHLRTTWQSFPHRRGYLQADAHRARYWRDRLATLGGGLKVGLAWNCGRSVEQTVDRSLQLAGWAEVLRVPGVRFVSLEQGAGAEIAAVRDQFQADVAEVLPSGRGDLDDLAALISSLDLVIASPQTVAHLAGALGAPVWVPLASWPSWRWLLEGETCPWYPSMWLFRQKGRDGWDSVFAQVASQLRNAEMATCQGK